MDAQETPPAPMDNQEAETPPSASYSLPPGRFWTEGGHRYWQPDPPPGPDSMTTHNPNGTEVLAWVEARRRYWQGIEQALRILCAPAALAATLTNLDAVSPGGASRNFGQARDLTRSGAPSPPAPTPDSMCSTSRGAETYPMTLTELPEHLHTICPMLAMRDAAGGAMAQREAELVEGMSWHLAERLAPLPARIWPDGCDLTLGMAPFL